MTYCPMCGTNNDDKFQFCVKCGASLKSFEEKFGGDTTLRAPPPTPEIQNLAKRAFWLWLLLSILVSEIFYYVYYYFNFDDLNKLDLATPKKEGYSLFTNKSTVLVYIILSVFIPIPIFILILNYWKYKKLNDYIKYNSNKNSTKLISIGGRLTLLIFQYLFTYAALGLVIYFEFFILEIFTLIPIDPFNPIIPTDHMILIISLISAFSFIGLIFRVFIYITDAKWQTAYNEQVLIVNPYAQEKMFV
ncbi:MAG: zinc ribbon domain-containing protein [Candidatus Heimdallarchaeota archaeon]|nr:zinc ribbon domain-containing protein [Candidatus Heimdallarchaeota archaeon]